MLLSLSNLLVGLFPKAPLKHTLEQALEIQASLRGRTWATLVSARSMMIVLTAQLQLLDKPASSKQLLLLNSKLMRRPDKAN